MSSPSHFPLIRYLAALTLVYPAALPGQLRPAAADRWPMIALGRPTPRRTTRSPLSLSPVTVPRPPCQMAWTLPLLARPRPRGSLANDRASSPAAAVCRVVTAPSRCLQPRPRAPSHSPSNSCHRGTCASSRHYDGRPRHTNRQLAQLACRLSLHPTPAATSIHGPAHPPYSPGNSATEALAPAVDTMSVGHVTPTTSSPSSPAGYHCRTLPRRYLHSRPRAPSPPPQHLPSPTLWHR